MSRNGAPAWPPEASEKFRQMVEAGATFEECCVAFPDRAASGIKWRIKKVKCGFDPTYRPVHGQFVKVVERFERPCICCRRPFVSINKRTNWMCRDCVLGHTDGSRVNAETHTVSMRKR